MLQLGFDLPSGSLATTRCATVVTSVLTGEFSLTTSALAAQTLAMSVGVYGLLRKKVNLPAVVGLFVETMLVLPIALGYLILLYLDQGTRTIFDGASLALGGVITVIPLVFFAAAATRLPLTTLGFVQYLAPTITLLLAIFLYDETVPAIRWFTFSMIWLAVVIFSLENLYQYRKRRLGDGK
jgi:chloramphenicol-sensitive protein RarD